MVAQVTKLDYETKTLAIANALLMATREKKNLFAQMRDQMRWDDKIMDFAMGNPGLKVQLFRFIDALPALRSKARNCPPPAGVPVCRRGGTAWSPQRAAELHRS